MGEKSRILPNVKDFRGYTGYDDRNIPVAEMNSRFTIVGEPFKKNSNY